MQDLNALAQSLINALKRSTESSINLLGVQRRNSFEDVMNRSAARGTLYSGAGGAQQSRYDGERYLPAVTQQREQLAQKTIGIQGDLLNTNRKIESLQRSANEINGITFDHLLD